LRQAASKPRPTEKEEGKNFAHLGELTGRVKTKEGGKLFALKLLFDIPLLFTLPPNLTTGAFTIKHNTLVQLPGFARVRPPTPDPLTPHNKKQKTYPNTYFFYVEPKKNIVKKYCQKQFQQKFPKNISKKIIPKKVF
jgi:hypothetical protein